MQHQSSANETLALHCICIYMPKNIITHLFPNHSQFVHQIFQLKSYLKGKCDNLCISH